MRQGITGLLIIIGRVRCTQLPVNRVYYKVQPLGRLLLALVLSLFVLGSAAAERVVRVGIYENKPMVFLDEDGKPAGLHVDVVKSMAERYDWKLEFVYGTWPECLERLEKGQIDVQLDIGFSEERKARFDFNDEDIFSTWAQVYVTENSGIRNIEELNRKKVAVLREDVHFPKLKKMLESFGTPAEFVLFDDYETAFKAVQTGAADAVLASRIAGAQLQQRDKLDTSDIVLDPIHVRWAFPKGSPADLRQMIDAALREQKLDPESAWHKGIERWLGSVKVGWPDWVKWLLVSFAAIVLLLFVHSMLLRAEVRRKTRMLEQERHNLERIVEKRTEELSESLKRLEDANLRLQEANRHKSRFLSSMSHELRTPLNAILGFSDLLAGQFFGALNPKQLEYTRQLEKSGKHLLALINDILDITKIDAGAMEVTPEQFHPREMIDATVNMLSAQFREKQLTTKIRTSKEVESISGDLRKCKQILLNLLSNALKYTPPGGEIRVTTERHNTGFIRVSVTDTGVGIPEEEQGKIFSEFHQADRVRDEQLGGTGIGLALTRRLVELHGGSIGVKSKVGEGSTFWFTLPIQTKTVATPFIESSGAIPAIKLHKRRLLLAEDNEANVRLMLDMLAIHGHEVVVARTGREAIDLAVKHKPELILMDLRMPDMDGLEATRELRKTEEFRHTPIIMVTASAGADAKELCLQAGCTAHLPKPVQTKELFRVLQTYLPQNNIV